MSSTKSIDKQAELLKEKIQLSRNILITTHHNPDGDAIGSSLALRLLLQRIGKKANILVPNTIPDYLLWMPEVESIVVFEDRAGKAKKMIESADLIFCLDYNSFSRTKFFEEEMKNATGYKVIIDHHPQPSNEFDHYISMVESPSTAQLVYQTIDNLGFTNLIDKEIAACLFTGITTDTGSFSFSCNDPSTYHIVANLIETGMDAERIHQLVYDTYSESRTRLLGYCLSQKLVVLKDHATAYISLSKHELESHDFQPGDTEGIVNYALGVKNIVFAALFTEKDDLVRISFRSKGDFSVNEFARTHFEGGGHKNAAGADSYQTLDETITHFVGLLGRYKESLHAQAELMDARN